MFQKKKSIIIQDCSKLITCWRVSWVPTEWKTHCAFYLWLGSWSTIFIQFSTSSPYTTCCSDLHCTKSQETPQKKHFKSTAKQQFGINENKYDIFQRIFLGNITGNTLSPLSSPLVPFTLTEFQVWQLNLNRKLAALTLSSASLKWYGWCI